MKIYMLILLFFTVTAAGFFKAAGLKRKVYEIQGLINFILVIKDRLSYFKTPINILLSTVCELHSGYRIINMLNENLKKDSNISCTWQSVDCEHIIGEQACHTMDEFFSSLGSSGIEGQTALCDSTLRRLEHCKEKAEEDAENKAKLYKSIGFLAGAFAVIIFV